MMRILIMLVFIILPWQAQAEQITESAWPHGGIKFNHAILGYVAEISAADAGTYYGFINGVAAANTYGMTFTEDDVNGDYLLIEEAGPYQMFLLGSVSLGSPAGEDVHCAIFVNDEMCCVDGHVTFVATVETLPLVAIPDFTTLAVGDKVRIKCKTDGNNKTISIEHIGISVWKAFNTHTRINQTGTKCYGCLK